MKMVTRAQAKAQGLKHFYTGQPCAHGHDANRNTKSGHCYECHNVHKRAWVARLRAAAVERRQHLERNEQRAGAA